MPLSLDLLIPTFNRSALLTECLESVLQAAKPDTLDWRVTVVDNNSPDNTAEVVRSFMKRYGERVRYLFEKRQGKSAALNCGIRASDKALVGMIDDDEQVDESWFQVVAESFQNTAVDFIGGPCHPLWRTQRPDWLPSGREGVLGTDERDALPVSPVAFGAGGLFLHGGNAVIRRAVLERVGGYSQSLGRVGNDLGSCEDHDMFDRLLAAGMRGLFVPQLVVYQVVPPERVSRSYFRRWCFRRAQSLAVMERARRQNVKHIGRVPRYMVGDAVRALPAWVRSRKPARRFTAELKWWDLAGFLLGAYLKPRPDADR